MDGSVGEGDLVLIQTFFALLWKLFLKNTSEHKNNLIYIIKQEGLYQNKLTLSLASIHNCKMAYSTRNQIDKEPLCGCATSKSLYIFIYYYISLFLNWSRLDFHRSLGHPREETVRGRSAGSFNEQRLIIEPTSDLLSKSYYELYSQISDYWVM